MSLRARAAGFLIALSLILLAATYAIHERVVMPTFVALERMGAERDVSRCLEAVEGDLRSLLEMVNDWACWDDTYEYAVDRNPRFEASNLAEETFENAHLNLIAIVDVNYRVVWGQLRAGGTGERLEAAELFAAIADPRGPIPQHKSLDGALAGIVVTRHGPLLLAARPILTTRREGPARGSLIMGRFFRQAEVEELASRTHVKLSAWAVGGGVLPREVQQRIDAHTASRRAWVEEIDAETLHAYRVLTDVYGRPALLVRCDVPREITSQGRVASRVASGCSLAGGLITLAVIWGFLRNSVIAPLRTMVAHMMRVKETGEMVGGLRLERTDEIGALAEEFNHMAAAVAQSRQEALDRNAALNAANEQLYQEMQARQKADEQIRYIAFHDSLTGLANRALLMQRLRECIERSAHDAGYRFGLLFVDVDNFKLVNDTLGHRAGDMLLQHLACEMRAALRTRGSRTTPRDLVARLGGDEFVIVLDDIADAASAQALAQRMQRAASTPCDAGSRTITPSLSIGLAVSQPPYRDGAEAMRDADTALYHAKAQGKGRIAVFDQAMRSRMLERADLECDLQLGVRERQFTVHYQPIVSLATGRVRCLEALVRWNHPVRGLLGPDAFLPVAEQAGLMDAIGQMVIEQVIRQLAQWRSRPWPAARDLSVSINLSASQIVESHLLEMLDGCLEQYAVEACAIKVELTESTAMRNLAMTRRVIDALQERGIEVYLDDFGTGYSSLATLHSLPFAAIKLDKSFMEHIALEPESQITVQAISMIARSRNMRLVAEGVETAEQLAILQELSCEYAQGFYFSRPLPAEDAAAVLEAGKNHCLPFGAPVC